jgi:hypothetical protein
MSEPWLTEAEERRPVVVRQGCGCRPRTMIVLISLVVILVAGCVVANILVSRYRDRLRIQPLGTVIAPPPRATPVVVPPAGGLLPTPRPTRASG